MKKTLVIIVLTLAMLGLVGYLLEAIQTKQYVDSLSNTNTSSVLSESEAKASFMEGCNTNEFTKQSEYCECTYEQIRNNTSINQLINDGLTLTNEQMQVKYENEISYCLRKVYENL